MTKTVLLATAAVLALTVGGIASATAGGLAVSSGHSGNVHRLIIPGGHTLYSQNSSQGYTGIDSQIFESTYAAYTDQGADDFTVPAGTTWKVNGVSVTGIYYNGSGPASGETVSFYKNKGGKPGKQVGVSQTSKGADNGGSFVIKLPAVQKLKGGASGTTYWVSVQADCHFSGCGQWGWYLTNVQHNNLSEWQNPGGGFGVCPTWGTTQSCVGYGPDFMFSLNGK